jgi:WD40 repeat protein
VTCIALSPSGKLLAAGGQDRIVRLWETGTGKSAGELKGHGNALCGLAFSRDGRLLASGDVQSTVRVWDVQDSALVKEIDNKSGTEILGLAFGPDGKELYCAGAWNDSSFLPKAGATVKINGKDVKWGGTLKIQGIEMTRKEGYFVLRWDVKTGKETGKYAGLDDKIHALALSADGKTLAGSSLDGKVCLWDTGTGKDRLHITAHPGKDGASVLAFSPDGKTLASAGADGTLRLWDGVTAKEIGQLRSADGPFTGIAFTRDGKTLVTGSSDTTVTLWDVSAAPPPPRRPRSGALMIR